MLALLLVIASLVYARWPAATQAATATIAGGCSSAATASADQAVSVSLQLSAAGEPGSSSGATALTLLLGGVFVASLSATLLVLAKLLFNHAPLLPQREYPPASWGLAEAGLVAMAFVLLSIAAGMAGGSTTQALTLQMATHTAVACLALSLAGRRGDRARAMGAANLQTRDVSTGILGYLTTLPLFYAVAVFSLMACIRLGIPMERHPVEGMLLAPGTPAGVLIAAGLLAVVVAPVCEEILFRGFLLPALERQLPRKLAIVVSAMVFASVHGGIHTLAPLLVLGLLLGWLFSRTRSLAAPVAAHALHNALTVVFASLAAS